MKCSGEVNRVVSPPRRVRSVMLNLVWVPVPCAAGEQKAAPDAGIFKAPPKKWHLKKKKKKEKHLSKCGRRVWQLEHLKARLLHRGHYSFNFKWLVKIRFFFTEYLKIFLKSG